MIGTCKLCGQPAALRESHLVPRFVIKWLKATGGGYLRKVTRPNRREQDGPKDHWLCETCEQLFSSRESYFKEQIFEPVLAQKNPIPYDGRFFYFLVSLSWRTVIATQAHPDFAQHRFAGLVSKAEQDWREYLLGQKAQPEFATIQVFISDITDGGVIPVKRFNSYFARAIDATVGSSKNQCFIYTKFARFLVFAYLTPCPFESWENTKIELTNGVLTTPQSLLDASVGGFIVHRAEVTVREYEANASPKTREVIGKHFQKALPSLINSDQLRAQIADFESVVRPPTQPGHRKIGRNEPCPCGSGKKFKHCHGA